MTTTRARLAYTPDQEREAGRFSGPGSGGGGESTPQRSETVKTSVKDVRVGDRIDFDAKTGNDVTWQDTIVDANGSVRPTSEWVRASGVHTVTSNEAVSSRTGGQTGRAGRVQEIHFDNGHYIEERPSTKLPVVGSRTASSHNEDLAILATATALADELGLSFITRLGYSPEQSRDEGGKFGEGGGGTKASDNNASTTSSVPGVEGAMYRYVLNGGTATATREAVENFDRAGGSGTSDVTLTADAQTLMSAIDQSSPLTDEVFRGIAVDGKLDDVLAQFQPGTDVRLPLGSATLDKELAGKFGQWSREALQGEHPDLRQTEILFRIGAGGHGLAIPYEQLGLASKDGKSDTYFASEKEVLVRDSYTVSAVSTFTVSDYYTPGNDQRQAVEVTLTPVARTAAPAFLPGTDIVSLPAFVEVRAQRARAASVFLVDDDGDPWTLDEFAYEVAARLGYSEDQSRDEGGRFGPGGGGLHPVNTEPSVGKSGKELATIAKGASLSEFPQEFQDKIVERTMTLTGSTPQEIEDRFLAAAERADAATVAEGAAWYQEAHDFADRMNTGTDGQPVLDPEVAYALLAFTSPGQDWESNKAITAAIIAAKENPDYVITQEEADRANGGGLAGHGGETKGGGGDVPQFTAGMRLGDIMTMPGGPHPGTIGAIFLTRATGLSPGKTGYGPFAKAVDIANRNDPTAIGRELNGEKVRSFYNCISEPHNTLDVVVDVHGMQTAVVDFPPSGRADAIRLRNVADNSSAFNSPSLSRASVGTYPVMADAFRNGSVRYNEAHKDAPLTPLQFQAVVWTQQKNESGAIDALIAPKALGLPFGGTKENTERSGLVRDELAQQISERWPDGVAIGRKEL